MYEAMEKRRSEFVSGVCAKGMTGYLYLQRDGGVLRIFWTCFRSLMQNIDGAREKCSLEYISVQQTPEMSNNNQFHSYKTGLGLWDTDSWEKTSVRLPAIDLFLERTI